ncbi:microtubule-associated serine/threonine-protein kinase 1-like protein [Lates japonicus]|uniref:Microtubule-associated serine/threonine-protein kinase 1-like protein n=1 Tax=Lates japonicus TaxID=270547 RepID=A0AAD3MVQ9_LATJO|nr:microtubule-associated serine/threonine-protein kinase 1-like protein [Lates japonicus]
MKGKYFHLRTAFYSELSSAGAGAEINSHSCYVSTAAQAAFKTVTELVGEERLCVHERELTVLRTGLNSVLSALTDDVYGTGQAPPRRSGGNVSPTEVLKDEARLGAALLNYGLQSLGWTASERTDLWQNVKDAPRGSADRIDSSMTVNTEARDAGQKRG